MKRSFLTITDLFCGAGGSSIGAEAAGGTLVMAANHWKLAIETHNSNFPNADHDCADVSQVRPQRYPSTDILIASPECTNHSLARGAKRSTHRGQMGMTGIAQEEVAEAERSRATMWDVPRFAEYHQYNLIVIENVVDARDWVMYPAWLHAMDALGYTHREVFLNSMFVQQGDWGAPQSRDRMYVVFWRKGNKAPELDFRPPSWCYNCERQVEGIQTWKNPLRRFGRYRQQYVYTCGACHRQVAPFVYPAARAIDWAIQGRRIGDRSRPLAEATMARIRQGIEKYWGRNLVVPLDRLRDGSRVALPADLPMSTQTARQDKALVEIPFVAELHGTSGARTVMDPLAAVLASGNHHGLVEPPLYIKNYTTRPGDGSSHLSRPVSEPLGSVTTSDHHALLIGYNGRPDTARPVNEPAGTIMPEPHHGLLQPPMLIPAGGTWRNGASPVSEPMTTRTTRENDGLFMTVQYNRTGNAHPVDEPIATLTSHDRHGLAGATTPEVDDCTFRMLEPHEIGAAMAFPKAYQVLGNKRQRVRQFGNAVTPPVMQWLVEKGMDSLR